MPYLVDCKSHSERYSCYFCGFVTGYPFLFPDKTQALCLYSALGQAAPNIAAISKGRAAAASIMSMIETESSPSKNLEDGIVMPKVSGQIEFREVCFSYPSRSNMVFENLSFSISAGKTFAVVGPSGSGKSTVISMVQRFYEPTSGT